VVHGGEEKDMDGFRREREREREREGTYVRDVETVIDFVQNKQIIK
jgi:hypothetical protein